MHATDIGIAGVLMGVIVVLGNVIKGFLNNRGLMLGAKRGNGNGKSFSSVIEANKMREQIADLHRDRGEVREQTVLLRQMNDTLTIIKERTPRQ